MRYIVLITFPNGRVEYVQGFDYTGMPSMSIRRETAQSYPMEGVAWNAGQNALSALGRFADAWKACKASVEPQEPASCKPEPAF